MIRTRPVRRPPARRRAAAMPRSRSGPRQARSRRYRTRTGHPGAAARGWSSDHTGWRRRGRRGGHGPGSQSPGDSLTGSDHPGYSTRGIQRVNISKGYAMSDPRGLYRWQKYRREYLKNNPICALCGKPATTVDHIVALILGGAMWDPRNHRPLCRPCNSSEGAKLGNLLRAQRAANDGHQPAQQQWSRKWY